MRLPFLLPNIRHQLDLCSLSLGRESWVQIVKPYGRQVVGEGERALQHRIGERVARRIVGLEPSSGKRWTSEITGCVAFRPYTGYPPTVAIRSSDPLMTARIEVKHAAVHRVGLRCQQHLNRPRDLIDTRQSSKRVLIEISLPNSPRTASRALRQPCRRSGAGAAYLPVRD